MNKEEILKSIEQIGLCEDDNERKTLLVDLTGNINNVFTEIDNLNKNADDLKATITQKDELLSNAQKFNNDMFLKLTEQKQPSDVLASETGIEQEPKKEYKSYEELTKKYL